MRIVTVGGGPAGLYASLLLKKAHPEHAITVLERNPAGATYGWGVVFSDRTLGEFREADARTYDRITDAFVQWDAIDVRFRGEVIRSGGHVFAGIARRHLLRILQERCAELGVDLRFETDLTDPAHLPDADLVIAADGVRSVLRDARADAFGPSLREGRARYIWYGADLALDSFTFMFRENEHGFFQVHAYPFDGTTSTFIVECAEDTWRRAGLDAADEAASIAYCERLFADDLRGARLRSNASRWIRFVTVKNRTWHDGKLVLIGDAAHTAHFSIGSGTKLAMEDAISLARAIETRPTLDAALAEYESERKPVVERFQEAAAESRRYFEELYRRRHRPAPQFAFHLLTRSGRIDYDVLRTRDASYADDVDRWYAGVQGGAAPPPLFTGTSVRGLALRSRGVVTHGRSALAGAGLVLTEPAAVSAEGRITPEDLRAYDDDPRLAPVVRDAREAGAAAGIRLVHAGRRGATRPRTRGADLPLEEGWPLVGPSPVPYGRYGATPRELDERGMDAVGTAFVEAARRAAATGFDLALLHMGHGYLLGSFLSAASNRRTDAFGGDLEARLRFPIRVLEAVRRAWEGPLGITLNGADGTPGGITPEEAVRIAVAMREAGCDLVEVVAGQTTPRFRPHYGPAYLAPLADAIRTEADIATLVGGAITTTGRANTVLAAGRADLVLLDAPR